LGRGASRQTRLRPARGAHVPEYVPLRARSKPRLTGAPRPIRRYFIAVGGRSVTAVVGCRSVTAGVGCRSVAGVGGGAGFARWWGALRREGLLALWWLRALRGLALWCELTGLELLALGLLRGLLALWWLAVLLEALLEGVGGHRRGRAGGLQGGRDCGLLG